MSGEPLRVCFVIQKLFDLTGGAERVFLQAATAMAKRGMAVEILTFDRAIGTPQFPTAGLPITNLMPALLQLPQRADAKPDRTPNAVKRIPHGGLLGHVKWAATHGLFALRLKAALRQRRPDAVVAFLPPAITAAVKAGQDLGLPVIASTHNVPEEDFGMDSPRWDQNPVYRRRARHALSQATAITVLQDSFLDWFTPAERARAVVLPNPITRLSPPLAPPPERDKQILSVGRLNPVKNHDLLIDAWAKLRGQFPDWRIDIYGEGPSRDALTALIMAANLQDVVTLHGNHPDLGPIYDKAALLCHPATFEGFGLAVGEAMAHGTPALGFADCPGIDQLITPDVDGWLLAPAPDRAAALADGLRNALMDQQALRRKGEAARAISTRFSPEAFATDWEALIYASTGTA